MVNIELSKDILLKIEEELKIGLPNYSDSDRKAVEDVIDFRVMELLVNYFDSKLVKLHKTGNDAIDKMIPSWHGSKGTGQVDVSIYNLFNNEEVSVIIEDKTFDSKEEPTPQAKHYATALNKVCKLPTRIVIGNHPAKDLEVRVLVGDNYEPLYINGKLVKGFVGPEIVKLVYDNPDVSEFILSEKVDKPFTQKDFHNILNKLKNIYRNNVEIGLKDNIAINFTVAFIALKMIMEKQGKKWESITTTDDLEKEIKVIIGDASEADMELQEKYKNIFVISNKVKGSNEDKIEFDFYDIVHSIKINNAIAQKAAKAKQKKQDANDNNSNNTKKKKGKKVPENLGNMVLMNIHKALKDIPEGDLSIDLFGEVYECLANNKIKSDFGTYFTRRHIIQSIIRLFLSEKDISDIVEYEKVIADPACGTGGFLTESFKYIKEHCKENYPDKDISELASKIVVGYDIIPENVGRTRINMTIAGDGFSDIQSLDTLQNPNVKENVDYIVTNVPYGKGSFAITDANSTEEFLKGNNNKRLELNFLLKIISMLKQGGKAAIVVPEGLLEAPSLSDFRAYLLKTCKVKTIISLPKHAFAPYTNWKTYVIFIEKRISPLSTIEDVINLNESIWGYIVDNDGYANSNKRYITDLRDENGLYLHNDLEGCKDIKGIYQKSKIEKAFNTEDKNCLVFNEWGEEIVGKKYGFISLQEIAERKVVKYKVVDAKELKSRLKIEADNKQILSNETHEMLLNYGVLTKKGYSFTDKVCLDENGELKEDFVSILDELGIEYNSDDGKYYDTNIELVTYSLPLIPEKYFRKKEVKEITLDELTAKVELLEEELHKLFGGVN